LTHYVPGNFDYTLLLSNETTVNRDRQDCGYFTWNRIKKDCISKNYLILKRIDNHDYRNFFKPQHQFESAIEAVYLQSKILNLY